MPSRLEILIRRVCSHACYSCSCVVMNHVYIILGELQNALCHTPESSSLATTVSSNRHDFPSQSTPQSHSHSKSMDDDDAAIEYYALSEVTDSEESNGTLSSNSNIGPGGSEILPNLYLDYLEDLCATSENSTQEAPKHVYKGAYLLIVTVFGKINRLARSKKIPLVMIPQFKYKVYPTHYR